MKTKMSDKLPPSLPYRFAAHTDPGRVRKRNEDAYALPPRGADWRRWGILLTVADGVGGLYGGQAASQQAVHHLQALFYANTGPAHPGDRLREAFEGVNALNHLIQREEGLHSHLTTLVALLVRGTEVWVANVGDSRAYLIQSATQQRRQLTEDHSSHVRQLKAGLLTSEDKAETSKRALTRAIGLAQKCQADLYHYTWDPGDSLVLCTDGLDGLPEEEMVKIVRTVAPPQVAQTLVERAVTLDGRDNATALIAHWLAHAES